MGNPVSQKRWFLSSVSQRNLPLRRVKSYSITDDSDVELVNAVGENAPIGFREKVGGCTIEFDYYFEQGKPEVDWAKLKDDKEIFSLVSQDEGAGKRVQYLKCRVANDGGDGDDEGSHLGKVKIVATERKRL